MTLATAATLLILALGVSADAFAVSLGRGLQIRGKLLFNALVLAAAFGIAQAVMPLLGWLLVIGVVAWLAYSNVDAILMSLGRDPTLTGRTKIWEAVLRAIAERPVFGYGWKALWIEGSPVTEAIWAWNYHVPFFHAHNGYLDMTAQLGIVGLALSMLFLLTLAVRAGRHFLTDPHAVGGWPLLVVITVLIYNATEVVAFQNTTWILLIAFSSLFVPARDGGLRASRLRRTPVGS